MLNLSARPVGSRLRPWPAHLSIFGNASSLWLRVQIFTGTIQYKKKRRKKENSSTTSRCQNRPFFLERGRRSGRQNQKSPKPGWVRSKSRLNLPFSILPTPLLLLHQNPKQNEDTIEDKCAEQRDFDVQISLVRGSIMSRINTSDFCTTFKSFSQLQFSNFRCRPIRTFLIW